MRIRLGHALRQGARHVAAAPGLVIFVWMVNLLVALPAAVIVGEAIHESVEWSATNESLRRGFDTGWLGEFKADATGLAATFEPGQIGVGATFGAADSWWNGELFNLPLPVMVPGMVFSCVWLFLMGGILTRLYRPWERWKLSDVVAAGSEYFWRFARLALLSGVAYYGVIRLARWLFPWIGDSTRDVTSEKTVLLYNLAAAVVVIGMLALIKAISDYAKISMVVDGRRSAVAAALNGLAFVLRRPVATAGLVVLFTVLTALLVVGYARVDPGVTQATPVTILLGIAVSQLYLVLRLVLRLGLLASEVALFGRQT